MERARISAEPLPVIVVGGGSILVEGRLPAMQLVLPDHYAVANAVGAAIAQVSGEVDRVYALAEMTRDAALDDAKAQATAAAVAAGARADSIEIVDVEDVPLAYCPAMPPACASRRWGNCMSDTGIPLTECDLLPLSLGAALLGTAAAATPISACFARAN